MFLWRCSRTCFSSGEASSCFWWVLEREKNNQDGPVVHPSTNGNLSWKKSMVKSAAYRLWGGRTSRASFHQWCTAGMQPWDILRLGLLVCVCITLTTRTTRWRIMPTTSTIRTRTATTATTRSNTACEGKKYLQMSCFSGGECWVGFRFPMYTPNKKMPHIFRQHLQTPVFSLAVVWSCFPPIAARWKSAATVMKTMMPTEIPMPLSMAVVMPEAKAYMVSSSDSSGTIPTSVGDKEIFGQMFVTRLKGEPSLNCPPKHGF